MEKVERMKKGGFFKTNWPYLLWCVFYVVIVWLLLGATLQVFILTVVMYAASISIALSPVGEMLLRYMQGARKVSTRQEREYIFPLFNDVYNEAKKIDPSLSRNIDIYIIDGMYVNAFAMGRNTVAVTRGAIETFSEEQLRGVIGHELGHISNGDTKALLINVVGNGIFSIGLIVLNILLTIVQIVANIADKTGIGDLILRFMKFVVSVGSVLFTYIGQIILSINSRGNEYRADDYAYQLGFGEELVEALYQLHNMGGGGKMGLFDRLKASHPYLAERIARLETKITGVEITVR